MVSATPAPGCCSWDMLMTLTAERWIGILEVSVEGARRRRQALQKAQPRGVTETCLLPTRWMNLTGVLMIPLNA